MAFAGCTSVTDGQTDGQSTLCAEAVAIVGVAAENIADALNDAG